MRFVIALLLVLTAWVCPAQKIIRIDYGDEPRIVASGFTIAEVVDNRTDTTNIGVVQVGMMNKKKAAQLDGGCARSLRQYVQLILSKADSGMRVAMVIKDLRISENTLTMQEFARLHVTYAFYNVDDEKMPLIFSFSRNYEQQGLDVTAKHEENIRTSVREALQELSSAFDKGAVQPLPEVTPYAAGDYPILLADAPKRGVYRSFEEFRDNIPSLTDFIICEKHNTRVRRGTADIAPCYRDVKGRYYPMKEQLWGFSDGKKIYIYQNQDFYELVRANNAWTFHARSVSKVQPEFGLLGIVGKGSMIRFAVDMNNGQVFAIGQ